ncbi:MAG: hypothetical protein ACI9R3_003054 [Verrucomicrobiales bacterium]|jgi:hypothetical protein
MGHGSDVDTHFVDSLLSLGLVRKLTVRRCAGFFVSTKADFSDDSELSELKSNAGDGQKGKQICTGYFRTGP